MNHLPHERAVRQAAWIAALWEAGLITDPVPAWPEGEDEGLVRTGVEETLRKVQDCSGEQRSALARDALRMVLAYEIAPQVLAGERDVALSAGAGKLANLAAAYLSDQQSVDETIAAEADAVGLWLIAHSIRSGVLSIAAALERDGAVDLATISRALQRRAH